MDVKLVLNPLPGSEVSSVLISVLPDSTPAGKDRRRCSRADLLGRGSPALAEALQHQSMGLLVKRIELRRNMGLRADVLLPMKIVLAAIDVEGRSRVIRVRVRRNGTVGSSRGWRWRRRRRMRRSV